MFDTWCDEFSRRALRVFDPPRRVLVSVGDALPGGVGMFVSRREPRPLWMRGAGVHLEQVMPGRQIAWCLQSTGTWWAIVDVDVSSANGLARLVLQTWVRAEHVQLDTAENRARAGLTERRSRS